MPATKPQALAIPLPSDDHDNEIVASRDAIRDHADALDDLAGRVTAIENAGGGVTGTPSAIVPIDAAQEAALQALQVSAFALLKGPTGEFLFRKESQ